MLAFLAIVFDGMLQALFLIALELGWIAVRSPFGRREGGTRSDGPDRAAADRRRCGVAIVRFWFVPGLPPLPLER